MSLAKDLVILAVTNMHGGVCTAGIDAEGTWIRPVRPTTKSIDGLSTISDYCLLPIDFFHRGKSHLFRRLSPLNIVPYDDACRDLSASAWL